MKRYLAEYLGIAEVLKKESDEAQQNQKKIHDQRNSAIQGQRINTIFLLIIESIKNHKEEQERADFTLSQAISLDEASKPAEALSLYLEGKFFVVEESIWLIFIAAELYMKLGQRKSSSFHSIDQYMKNRTRKRSPWS